MSYADPYQQRPITQHGYSSSSDQYGDAPLKFPTYEASAEGVTRVAATPYTSYDLRDEKEMSGVGARMGAGGMEDRPISQWTIPPPPKSTGILRMWRKENRASWVKVCLQGTIYG